MAGGGYGGVRRVSVLLRAGRQGGGGGGLCPGPSLSPCPRALLWDACGVGRRAGGWGLARSPRVGPGEGLYAGRPAGGASPNRQLEFDSALDFYTPTRAAGALRSLSLQLIESPVTGVSFDNSNPVVCALPFMDEDDLVTSADETVSTGSTDTESALY